MKVGDKVQVVDNPISLLKIHAGIKGKIVKHMPGNEWLVDLGEYHQWWWAKGYDLVVVGDD